MNKRQVGDYYENLACTHLRNQGACIVDRNYRALRGEIDIIARDGRYLCFIEVKYRKDNRFGAPEGAVTISKQRQICKLSKLYLYSKNKSIDVPIRYDVIAITDDDNVPVIRWHKNAFDYVG
ncbi:MAG: YraN family protein [Butyrivibrio sp.]|uniref:YraN family protein n=1 Tax=Butyrivibrio sp. TaxID=28121 RepID=UPI0025B9F757|nr:YraN family protein [Butyrivibrio sp.]MBQ6587783.1 YraN family protein [Butyrivibrio sp.]